MIVLFCSSLWRSYGETLSKDINLFDFRTTVAGKSTYTFTGKTTEPRTVHYFTVNNGASSLSIAFDDKGYTSGWMRYKSPDGTVYDRWTAGTDTISSPKVGQWAVWVNEDGTGGYNLEHTYTLTVTVNY